MNDIRRIWINDEYVDFNIDKFDVQVATTKSGIEVFALVLDDGGLRVRCGYPPMMKSMDISPGRLECRKEFELKRDIKI